MGVVVLHCLVQHEAMRGIGETVYTEISSFFYLSPIITQTRLSDHMLKKTYKDRISLHSHGF